MAADFKGTKNLTAMQQYLDFKRNLPAWKAQVQANGFTAKSVIQPTPLSALYSVRITYQQDWAPVIRVLNGQLKPRVANGKIRHTYDNGSLCLYYPKAREWTPKDLISETIVPWISVWLYYYEIWHATGLWLGGGIEH
ncbi:MAG: hypothetical protein WKF66_10070 [Pedobacter sp.]